MTALFDEYPTGQPAWDEMLAAPDQPRSAYAGVYETLRRMTPEDLNDRVDTLSRHYVDTGVTFDYAGEERAFPLDLVPRIITADDWDVVDRGVKQRVTVLEMLLADIYSGEASGIPASYGTVSCRGASSPPASTSTAASPACVPPTTYVSTSPASI